MTGPEFIDLLSSDEEAVPTIPKRKPKNTLSTDPNTAGPTSFLAPRPFYPSDDFEDAIQLDESYSSQSTKKRKLNPTSSFRPANATTGVPAASTTRNIADFASDWEDQGFAELDDEDPILFTSSAHVDLFMGKSARKGRVSKALDIQSEDSDYSLPEDIFDAPSQRAATLQKSSSLLSEKTRAVLERLSTQITHSSRAFSTSKEDEEVEILEKKHAKRSKKSANVEGGRSEKVSSKEGKEARAQERQQAKEQRAKEREEELLRKREEKEKKAMQKQKDGEIAEVNKAKLDKKTSTPEMIVDFPASLHGQRVDSQAREFLKNLGVETAVYQSGIPDVVKWRRKVKARWDSDEGRWEPLPRMQIEDEKHVMCILPAPDYISLSTAKDNEEDLDTHVSKLKSAYPGCTPIYLIEGLTRKLRESKTAANRQYQNEVLNQDPSNSTTTTSQTTKRKKPPPTIVDEEVIEDSILRLQVIHKCLIHHTTTHVDTAEWIATFTQHISTIPYKLNRLALTTSTSSCLEPGQIKTGVDASDTYSKILQEIIRITPPIAQAIINEYPTVTNLVRAFREADERDSRNGGGAGGSLILERLQKATNRNGGFSDRCVGKAISRRVYSIFMERDPGSTRV